jgi:hypothetical protein
MCLLAAPAALSQALPVVENLWRLVPQEDTDGDRRITIHDHTTPFTLRDKNGAMIRTVGDVYQLSVLLQELKSAEGERHRERALEQLGLDESVVDRTHRLQESNPGATRANPSMSYPIFPAQRDHSRCVSLH